MLNNRRFRNPLFLDIETVPCVGSFDDLDDRMKGLWLRKAEVLGVKDEGAQRELFGERGGIFAEFGKVVVICVGYVGEVDGGEVLYVKGLCGDDEGVLLDEFKDVLGGFSGVGDVRLCAHNGKEFDFPYLCRRMTVHGIGLPGVLDIGGKKPWEVGHLDTVELWKFGDRKSYTSLDLLGATLGVPSSKDGMKGSEVGRYYYEKGDLDSVLRYCMKDVVALAQIFRRLNFLDLIPEDAIEFVG